MNQRLLPDVFISYSRTDAVVIDKINKDLGGIGLLTWVDKISLIGGDDWKSRINLAISDCKVMVAVLSSTSIISEYVRMEYQYAQYQGKIIIPVLIEKCALPTDLNNIQAINIYDSYIEGLKKLVVAIRYNLNTPQLSEIHLKTSLTNGPDKSKKEVGSEIFSLSVHTGRSAAEAFQMVIALRNLFDEARLFSLIPSSGNDNGFDYRLSHPLIDYVYHIEVKTTINKATVDSLKARAKRLPPDDKIILFSLEEDQSNISIFDSILDIYNTFHEKQNLYLLNKNRLHRYTKYVSYSSHLSNTYFVPPEIIAIADQTKRIFPTHVKILSMAQMRGGTGKTTATFFTALSLAKLGNKVLVIDMDTQCNLTQLFLGGGSDRALTLINYYDKTRRIDEIISKTLNNSIDIIPGHNQLSVVNKKSEIGSEFAFPNDLHVFLQNSQYDWVLIDTSPNHTFLTREAFLSSHFVLAPLNNDSHAISGFNALQAEVNISQTLIPSSSKIIGGFVNQWRTSKFQVEGIKELRQTLLKKDMILFNSLIPYDENFQQYDFFDILTHPSANALSAAFDNLMIEFLDLTSYD